VEELIGKRADVFWADPAKHAVLVEELSRSGHVRDCGNVKLESDFPSQGPVVHADRIQIKQMLTNLVSNASEAVGEHEGRISVAVSVVDREEVLCSRLFPTDWEPNAGRYACLEVSDTGSGLDVATLEKIFDPFFSTKFTGRGLGLPVVLGIVRALDGAVSVESRSGHGATFRVYLPLPEQTISPAGKTRELASQPGEAEGPVLLVDNEPVIRDFTREMLKRLGCNVMVAADGAEAVEIFRARKDEFSLAIIDVIMPRMDDWETLSALRSLRPDLPAVLVSGYNQDQVMRGDHPGQPESFLQKPFQFADLKAVLAMTRRRKSHGEWTEDNSDSN
jgi:two-component system, cell cycle sensor histidine kinase and response regulator CckA